MIRFATLLFLLTLVTAQGNPSFRATGTVSGSTTAATPGLPAGHTTNDILFCIVETANENSAGVPTNATSGTWVEVTNSPQGTGTGAAAGSTGLRVYWMRDPGTTIGTVTVPDSGDHTIAQIAAFSGCATTGNPWAFSAGGAQGTASTSLTMDSAANTIMKGGRVIAIFTHAVDTSTTQFSSGTISVTSGNAVIGTAVVHNNVANTSGVGGGFSLMSAVYNDVDVTGSYNWTATSATSTKYAGLTLVLKPVEGTNNFLNFFIP